MKTDSQGVIHYETVGIYYPAGEDTKSNSDDFLKGMWVQGLNKDGYPRHTLSSGQKIYHYEIQNELIDRGYKPRLAPAPKSPTGYCALFAADDKVPENLL